MVLGGQMKSNMETLWHFPPWFLRFLQTNPLKQIQTRWTKWHKMLQVIDGFWIVAEALLQSIEATAAPQRQQSPCQPVLAAVASPLSVDRGMQQPREGWNDHWLHSDLAHLPKGLWAKSDHLHTTQMWLDCVDCQCMSMQFWWLGLQTCSKHWHNFRFILALCGKSWQARLILLHGSKQVTSLVAVAEWPAAIPSVLCLEVETPPRPARVYTPKQNSGSKNRINATKTIQNAPCNGEVLFKLNWWSLMTTEEQSLSKAWCARPEVERCGIQRFCWQLPLFDFEALQAISATSF